MNNNLLILGAGGHGRVVKEVAETMRVSEKIDFLDDNPDNDVPVPEDGLEANGYSFEVGV